MIIDTLVVVVCLMADAPRIQRVEQVPVKVEVRCQPCNRFKHSFELSDSLFRVASEQAMQSALEKTKKEREKVLDRSAMDAVIQELKRNTLKP